MSKMNICKNEENWTCGNNEVVVDTPLNWIIVHTHWIVEIFVDIRTCLAIWDDFEKFVESNN